MEKRLIHFLLMAIVSLGLCQGFTSCSDKDDDEKSGVNDQAGEEQDASVAFWSVVGQLTSADQMTADYQGKQFAPTIGEASQQNPLTRIVATNDLETAAKRFASLVGLESGIDENTETYTWSNPAVGTLTYKKTPEGGTSLATVDVSIKQMPGLQQIVYCTPEQVGENATVRGVTYYRFGDVVKRKNDRQKWEYWICVRPAFGPEGKKKSHWVTTSPLPKKNLHMIDKSGTRFWMPTLLGKNEEQMQNFAEMLYAMLHPQQWYENITKNSPYRSIFNKGVPMFHDFSKSKVGYHNKEFWENVHNGWLNTAEGGSENLYKRVFGYDTHKMDSLLDDGLNLLTDGYSWWSSVSWNLYLYRTKYTNGEGKQLNMHVQESGKLMETLRAGTSNPFDAGDGYPQDSPRLSFDGETCFFIRHATGDELCGHTADLYTSFQEQNPDLTDVYVFNKKYNQKVGPEAVYSNAPSNVQPSNPEVGSFLATDGNFYKSKVEAEFAGGAVAIVMCVTNNETLERDTTFNGIAMALNMLQACKMSDITTYDCKLQSKQLHTQFFEMLDGLHITKQMQKGCDQGHNHAAASLCSNFEPQLNAQAREKYHVSDWFIPSYGQWLKAIKGIGLEIPKENAISDVDTKGNQQIANQFFTNHGLKWADMIQSGWTCSQYSKNIFVLTNYIFSKDEDEKLQRSEGNLICGLRPFLLFRY